MNDLKALIKRNTKLFFKDKGTFFTSLITPLILLFLYVCFLGDVYLDSFKMTFEQMNIGVTVPDKVLNALVSGQLFSSLLAVCCVTVAFCSNMIMVNDKVNGSRFDLTITPVKPLTLALGYYISTAISTLIITFVAMGVCLIYVAATGWFMSVKDILLLVFDAFWLTMFGTALSSIIIVFLSSQGQISAVGTIVSSGYGFICGAYMPISQFSETLQNIIALLPGTYGTSLLRTHAMNGSILELEKLGLPSEVIESVKDTVDSNLYFFGTKVSDVAKYGVLVGSVVLLIVAYIVVNIIRNKKPIAK